MITTPLYTTSQIKGMHAKAKKEDEMQANNETNDKPTEDDAGSQKTEPLDDDNKAEDDAGSQHTEPLDDGGTPAEQQDESPSKRAKTEGSSEPQAKAKNRSGEDEGSAIQTIGGGPSC